MGDTPAEVLEEMESKAVPVDTGENPARSSNRKGESPAPLPDTRAEREWVEAAEAVKQLTAAQKTKLLALLNDGDPEALTAISGIGKTQCEAIVQARPFKSLDDLRRVREIGMNVFADVASHGKASTSKRSSSGHKDAEGASKDGPAAKAA